jgi:aromatic ring-opening dioxygenase catalytic subunit (LigB family)
LLKPCTDHHAAGAVDGDALLSQEHYAMGQALALLRSQGILLLGSGMSFHSMSTLGKGMGQNPKPGQDKSKLPGQVRF